jgi:hypothetical protein
MSSTLWLIFSLIIEKGMMSVQLNILNGCLRDRNSWTNQNFFCLDLRMWENFIDYIEIKLR